MLPVELYRGEDALRADREQVLRRTWQFVGHESQVAATGDYLADVIGGAPVVVVRKADGALAGFHNVCRHRAGALVADGTGNCGATTAGSTPWTGACGTPWTSARCRASTRASSACFRSGWRAGAACCS